MYKLTEKSHVGSINDINVRINVRINDADGSLNRFWQIRKPDAVRINVRLSDENQGSLADTEDSVHSRKKTFD